MKPITGQYECTHQSGIGLDYFTSRLDRLTIYPNGRFLMITQDRSRLSNAAQSLMSGQQVSTAAPETRREGNYILQGNTVSFRFDDGSQEQGQVSWNGEGIQIGQNFFNKVSDSTMIPPTQRVKKDMDDIAKGLKIAGTIGGMALKAAKTVHSTIQAVQEAGTSQPNPFTVQGQGPTQGVPPGSQPGQQPQQAQAPYMQPLANTQGQPPMASTYAPPASVQPAQSLPGVPPTPRPVPPAGASVQSGREPSVSTPRNAETRFCDQCGAPARPGKRFCNQCGAELP
ncbi:MAG TPA: zinc ribbon domain-containing protein [Ktedonobacteraceae bacterium]|nr:zinc ribbon domain-containing protein [Ktedonobacteraceae bacterium]